ncbi:MAG: CocE/NonD family hydrolase [Blastocatellia bacterium]|nr:CocE/NonD family hydrolase [Blastocatellia bacterium]
MKPIRSTALWLSLFLLGLGFVGVAKPLYAQEHLDVRVHYTKSEHQIPMRDGVKLFTSVYAPKDTSRTYPIMLFRTPYSVRPYGPNEYRESVGPSELFAREGYIFVYQDVRGKYMSEGEYMNVRPHNPNKRSRSDIDESSDTYDTIEWLVKNIPNNNGRAGIWGISYPGFYATMGAIDSHPALKAASPQAPVTEWFIGDDFRHNGALFLSHAFGFFSSFGQPRKGLTTDGISRFDPGTPDGYKFFLELGPLANADKKYFKGNIEFWKELTEHDAYDAFWKSRTPLPHLKNVKTAVMTVGGWFDAEDVYGPLKTYEAIEKNNPGAYNILVMGPWYHGGWSRADGDLLGDIRFGSKTSEFYRENIELQFFNHYLKDKGQLKLPDVYVFETGSNRWKTYDQWPPKGARQESIYLQAGGRLSFEAPRETSTDSYDEYISDPNKPVPYIGWISYRMPREYMVADQRFASTRPDVVVYESEVLTEDITVAGPITASLYVSTTGTDSDFVVKLIDVYPRDAPDNEPNPADVKMGGYQMMVRGEPFRAKFRNSFEKAEAMTPGKVTKVEFEMPSVSHTFKRGHRIMVQIQSSWFPLVDRNPQKFMEIHKATESDFQKATQRIYRSREYGSHLKLSVLR